MNMKLVEITNVEQLEAVATERHETATEFSIRDEAQFYAGAIWAVHHVQRMEAEQKGKK